MPSTRDIERTERNGRFRARRKDSTSSDLNRHSFADGADKRHRRHGKSKSSSKKKKKHHSATPQHKSLDSVPSIASSIVKPLVEYSDVSSEDLSEPEAGEIQSEGSRANSYTDGEVTDLHHHQRQYYGGSPVRALGAGTSPISMSPSPPLDHQRHHIDRHYSSPKEPQPTSMHGATPEYEEDARRYARRKEKKHKREKKKKRSLSPSSSSGKKKKRKSRRHSYSASPHRIVVTDEQVEQVALTLDREKQQANASAAAAAAAAAAATWSESPTMMLLKDSTSPISPATPQEHRCFSEEAELEMSRQTSQSVASPVRPPTRQTVSPHTPLLPPRSATPETSKTATPKHSSPDRLLKRSPSFQSTRRTSMSPIGGSARRRPHSPSPPRGRRDHTPPRRREFSPTSILHRSRHSPSPATVRRREFSPSPISSHRRRTDGIGSPKRRRRDEPDRRHRHHDKERKDKRKSRSTRSPTSSRYIYESRLHMPMSRSRSRSPRWRKMSRSRSRSRRRSRTPKKSRSPSKSHKSLRKHKSKSPRPRIPSPHRSRARSPSSISARNLRVQAKISETSLFAELVKDRNMRELAYRKLQAAKEKAVSQDDVQIIEGTDEKDGNGGGANVSSEIKASTDNKDNRVVNNSREQPVRIGENAVKTPVDVVDIPVPMTCDDSPAGKTPPLPPSASQSSLAAASLSNPPSANVPIHHANTSSPNPSSVLPITVNNYPIAMSHSPSFPAPAPSVPPPPPPPPLPPLPQTAEPATVGPVASTILPQATVSPMSAPPSMLSATAAAAAPILSNIPPTLPPSLPSSSSLPIPVPAPNTIMSKFNPPNNLVPLKSVDPPKPPIVTFTTKSLKKLPLPPGINQNDLESIDSPPSRSPSPPKHPKPSASAKPPPKKSIKDLPMPPGRL